jgi:hypothetical protein
MDHDDVHEGLLHGAEVAMKHLEDIEADSAMVKDKTFLDPTVVSNFSREVLKRLEEATMIPNLVNKAKHAGSYSQRPRRNSLLSISVCHCSVLFCSVLSPGLKTRYPPTRAWLTLR